MELLSLLITILEWFGLKPSKLKKWFDKSSKEKSDESEKKKHLYRFNFKINANESLPIKNGGNKQNRILINLENKSGRSFTWEKSIFREKDNLNIEIETKRASQEIEDGPNSFLFENI
ncbi:MAG: hypothetical protein V1936_03785 [Patescibacteria group bacterium]